MKKWFVFLFMVFAALVSCVKEPAKDDPAPKAEPITFNLTASFSQDEPDTKARKTGWEADDVIFVF